MEDKNCYQRESFLIEEKLYESYISMRKSMLDYDNYKYENLDPYIKSKDFKAGFFAGVKIVLSLFINEDNFIN